MLYKLSIYLFVILYSSSGFSQARRSMSDGLQKGGYSFDFIFQNFQTKSLFDRDGNEVNLVDGESYRFNEVDLIGNYGYSKNLQFKAGVKFRSIDSVKFDSNDSQFYSVSDGGIQSALVSAHYIFDRVDNLLYRFEFDYRHFNYTNQPVVVQNTHQFLALGPDGQQIDFAFSLTYRPTSWSSYLSSKIGYRMPGSNLSDQMIYQLEVAKVWQYFALFAGVSGAQSMSNDPYGENNGARPVIATGPSKYFDAVNPSDLTPYAGFSLGLGSKWKIHFKGAQTASGQNTDKMQVASLHLEYFNTNPSGRNLYDESFKEYSYEGDINKISPSGEYATISVGLSDGANVGDRVDIFKDDFLGGNELVAAGQIVKSGASSSIIKVIKFYKGRVKEGMNVRGGN